MPTSHYKGMICLEFPSSHHSSQTKDKPGDNYCRLELSLDQCRYCGTHGPKCAHRLQNDCVCVLNGITTRPQVVWCICEHLPWGLATGTDRWTNQSARLLSQDMRGEKNSLSLFTYRSPEETSGGNVVTNLASFPKYSDFFRSVFWDTSTFRNFIVPFPFLFSDSALTSAAFWQFLGLRWHFVSCSSSPFASFQ